MRNEKGVYSDGLNLIPDFKNFTQNKFQGPCSVASIGIGIITECIADKLGLINNGKTKVLQTLKTMSGKQPGFTPAKNLNNGFFRHWIDMNTGERAWNSEYSSIDTALMISGALFAKQYFNDPEISSLADELFLSIQWEKCINDPQTGSLFMTFQEDGSGSAPLRPFNEYMIVAWMAKNYYKNNTRAEELWNNFFESPKNLPKQMYQQYELLTDNNWDTKYISNFCIQFPYYLCHTFSQSQEYLQYYKNAMESDRLWFKSNLTAKDFEWGLGAGPQQDGYGANQINNNKLNISSPHIIAGFIPIDEERAVQNLFDLANNGIGVYDVIDENKFLRKILWRFSLQDLKWKTDNTAAIDFSTMIFGLASHSQILGKEFFSKYNDFQFPKQSNEKLIEI